MSYGCVLWGNSFGARQIFLLQKKAIRIMTGIKPTQSCRPAFIKLGVITLPSLYIFRNVLYVKENLSMFNLRKDCHTYETRGRSNLDLPSFRLQKSLNSHRYLQVKFFNKLPQIAIDIPIGVFRSKLRKWLVNACLYDVGEFLAADTTRMFL